MSRLKAIIAAVLAALSSCGGGMPAYAEIMETGRDPVVYLVVVFMAQKEGQWRVQEMPSLMACEAQAAIIRQLIPVAEVQCMTARPTKDL